MPKQRQIIIVAGPNGAGKTTFAREYLLKEAHCPEQRMSIRFEWDPKKAETNLAKHGISFEEGIDVFADPLARIFPDRSTNYVKSS